MSRYTHSFAAGDTVVYRNPYRAGWFIGEIETIGKMYATIGGARIHIPKIHAKLSPDKDADALRRQLDAADSNYSRTIDIAARQRRDTQNELFNKYCEGNLE